MNDITLINMSIARRFGKKVLFERNSAGIFYLVAVLEKAGFKVNFYEHFLDHKRSFQEELRQFIRLVNNPSNLVGIGCHSVHLPFVVLAVKEIKRLFPLKKVILGGIGPSSVARELLKTFDFIDAVAVGEAEDIILEIVEKRGQDFKDIKGVVYRDGKMVHANAPRLHIENLDRLPYPAYQAVDFKRYQIPTVITSRGCPFGCPFCCLSSFWGRKIRYRSIDNVIGELRLLVERYGRKYVFFGDSTFITEPDRMIKLCRSLKKESLGLKWECLVRLDRIDEKLMKQMKDSGCEAIFYGLESGSDKVLKRIKQTVTVDKSLDIIRTSTKYFKTVGVSLMWGFPFETLKDFKETLKIRDYLEGTLHCQVQLRWLEPYPATPLYWQYRDKLFFPKKQSRIFNSKTVYASIARGKDFYEEDECMSGIRIATDVTNVRFIIAASHTQEMCGDVIKQNPYLFSDYCRFKTPALEEKLLLLEKYSLY